MDDPLIPPADLGESSSTATTTTSVRRDRRSSLIMVAFLVLAVVGWLALNGSDTDQQGAQKSTTEESSVKNGAAEDTVLASRLLPESLVAAELYLADPSARTARDLLRSIGGLDNAELGTASGAFDMLRFDPLDSDRLLATVRSSYGEAENQGINELWTVQDNGINQALWAPETAHDFAHFNRDGTITMWVRSGDHTDFAPRNAVLLQNDGTPISSTQPVFASRFTSVDNKVFALTGDSDYYSNVRRYLELVADDGTTRTVLDSGGPYSWIDSPLPGLLVAYPRDDTGTTAVWDTSTLERLESHPLAGRSYQRVAVSGDEATAVGITFGGELEQIDLATGRQRSTFGSVVPDGIDRPLTMNDDGSIAITVERSGLVTIWWVGVDEPIVQAVGAAAQPRWVAEQYAARASSVVSADAGRLALRLPARPEVPTTWAMIDTSIAGWIQRACNLAGRRLATDERQALGLPPGPGACPSQPVDE